MAPPSGNQWDQRYGEAGWAYGTAPNDFLKEVAPGLKKGRVLCLGDGEGRNGVYLATLGHAVTAVDLSQVGLDKAQALAKAQGVTLTTVHADLAQFVIAPGAWDAIVSIWCHLPSALRRPVHAAAAMGLAPGGVFVLEAYTPRQLQFKTGGPPSADFLPTLEGLRGELSPLRVEIGRELDRPIAEGRLHNGPSAVVQFMARQA